MGCCLSTGKYAHDYKKERLNRNASTHVERRYDVASILKVRSSLVEATYHSDLLARPISYSSFESQKLKNDFNSHFRLFLKTFVFFYFFFFFYFSSSSSPSFFFNSLKMHHQIKGNFWINVFWEVLKVLAMISYSKFHFFHTCWYFCSLETPRMYWTYPPKQSCRNDIFSAREPNICSLN